MEPNQTAATAEAGSVETPAQSQATPAAGQNAGEATATQDSPRTRNERRSAIANWLDKPATDPKTATPSGTETRTTEGEGSQPEVGEGADDLSKPPPADSKGADEDDGTDEEQEQTEQAAGPKKFSREAIERIRKLKGQKQALKSQVSERDEQLAQLRSENEQLKAKLTPKQPGESEAAGNPLADDTDPDAIRGKARQAQLVVDAVDNLMDDVVDNPDRVAAILEREGLKKPADGWTPEALRKELREIKGRAQNIVRAAPQRIQWIAQEDRSLEIAMTALPELEDPKSELASEVSAIVSARPWLKQHPDWMLLAAAGAIGLREIRKRAQPAPKTEQAPPPARPAPRAPRLPGTPRASVPTSQAPEADALRGKATAKGATREDRRAYVASLIK